MNAGAAARELRRDEFSRADAVWTAYHGMTGDPATDRIFAVVAGDDIVSLARCRRHPDGYEVDGVFTPEERRGQGYAAMAMDALVEACQHDTLYMYAVLELAGWYRKYAFVPITEFDLPPKIRERYAFAHGELQGANVQPMKREPGRRKQRTAGERRPC